MRLGRVVKRKDRLYIRGGFSARNRKGLYNRKERG